MLAVGGEVVSAASRERGRTFREEQEVHPPATLGGLRSQPHPAPGLEHLECNH